MRLYHYTATEHLPYILWEGLRKGEVPITFRRVRNAVWFTSDTDPSGHGLSDNHILTSAEKAIMGVPAHIHARFPDKRAVRITVDIDDSDPKLSKWTPWAMRETASLKKWRRRLNETTADTKRRTRGLFTTVWCRPKHSRR